MVVMDLVTRDLVLEESMVEAMVKQYEEIMEDSSSQDQLRRSGRLNTPGTKPRKLKEVYDVQSETVRKWTRQGLINFKFIQHNTRTTWFYDMDSIGEFIRGSRPTTLNESNTS